MAKSRLSNDEILEGLRNLAKRLGKQTLSKREVESFMSVSTVVRRFGNLGNALEVAGLHRPKPAEHFRGRGPQISDDELFRELNEIELGTGHEPRMAEMSAFGKYSTKPYTQRFGGWRNVIAHYRTWKQDQGNGVKHPSGHQTISATSSSVRIKNRNSGNPASRPAIASSSSKSSTQLYGEHIDFRGLRHAPINEQGVVFLFAMVSRELGFSIESVQQGFPDCEGKMLVDSRKQLWQRVRIEFEYKASNFKQHGHDPDQCEVVVCWINDWENCPLEVIELQSEILKLPSS